MSYFISKAKINFCNASVNLDAKADVKMLIQGFTNGRLISDARALNLQALKNNNRKTITANWYRSKKNPLHLV